MGTGYIGTIFSKTAILVFVRLKVMHFETCTGRSQKNKNIKQHLQKGMTIAQNFCFSHGRRIVLKCREFGSTKVCRFNCGEFTVHQIDIADRFRKIFFRFCFAANYFQRAIKMKFNIQFEIAPYLKEIKNKVFNLIRKFLMRALIL